jgi:hypothetical protein
VNLASGVVLGFGILAGARGEGGWFALSVLVAVLILYCEASRAQRRKARK